MKRNIIQRAWWRWLRLLGLKRHVWDEQFKAGIWRPGPRSPETIRRVQQLCRGGRLIEFGCGEGMLPCVLPAGTFSSYLGYDISEVAIQRAKTRAVEVGAKATQFEQSDMAQWNRTERASLVLVEECLYYLSPSDCERFLLRCSRCLEAEGSILVIVHSVAKHALTLAICRRVCRVREETIVGERVYLTLVPRTD